MKKLLILLTICLMAAATMANFPHSWPTYPIDGPIPSPTDDYFTLTTHDIASWDLFPGGGLVAATDWTPTDPGIGLDQWPAYNNTEFDFFFTEPGGTWRSGQLGWSMFDPAPNYDDDTLPLEYYDLSDWDGWTVSFHNESAAGINWDLSASLFLNLGWTDVGEQNLFVQGSWTSVPVCQWQFLTLDLSNVQAWGMLADGSVVDGDFVDISSDLRLAHISSLGIQIGSNTWEPGAAVKICIDRVVPAPGAILLGGIGVSFVGWLRRRRTL